MTDEETPVRVRGVHVEIIAGEIARGGLQCSRPVSSAIMRTSLVRDSVRYQNPFATYRRRHRRPPL